ncbi:MAG: RDD family protein [Cryobacterium sp.]|nr:RDD family protein [Cryobacterium sp.]
MTEALRCHNCGQSLKAGSARCVYCGVDQYAQPVQYLVPPTGMTPLATGRPDGSTPSQSPLSQPPTIQAASRPPLGRKQGKGRAHKTPLPATPPSATPPAGYAGSGLGPGLHAPRAPRLSTHLGDSFAGSVAGAGKLLAGFTLDVILTVGIALLVWLATHSLVYAGLALFEIAVALWVLEARTGATLGLWLVGVRVATADAPKSPGVGRSLVRRLVTGLGALAGGVGAWVVVGSAAWGNGGRGWPDVAARTVSIAVPPRAARARSATNSPMNVTVTGVGVDHSAPTPSRPAGIPAISAAPVVLSAPVVVSTLAQHGSALDDSVNRSQTGTQTGAQSPSSTPVPVQAEPVPQLPSPAPRTAPAPEQTTVSNDLDRDAAEPVAGNVLLIFDTGQREQFASPASINLGRNPSRDEASDHLVTVNDPESSVSKTHLRLEHSRGRTWVTDRGSTNGTDLLDDDGSVITLAANERVLLEEGTRVRIGNRAFTVSLMLGGER